MSIYFCIRTRSPNIITKVITIPKISNNLINYFGIIASIYYNSLKSKNVNKGNETLFITNIFRRHACSPDANLRFRKF